MANSQEIRALEGRLRQVRFSQMALFEQSTSEEMVEAASIMTGNPGMLLVRIPANLEGTLTERPAFYDPAWGLMKPRYSDTDGHRLPGFYLANEQFFRVLRLMSQLSQKELSTCGKWDSVESMKLIAVAVPGEVLLTPAEGQVQESLVLAYNLGNFMRRLALPEAMKHWSLTSLQTRMIKTGGRLVRHARRLVFQLAEELMTKEMLTGMLERISRLRLAPS